MVRVICGFSMMGVGYEVCAFGLNSLPESFYGADFIFWHYRIHMR